MKIHFIRQGYGMPLVLFHGWGFDHRVWLSLVPTLAEQYEVFLIDLPGFGLTESGEWPVFKNALLKVIPEQFALAGWSMGGLFATRLAIEEPRRVTHLLNIASSPKFIREEGWPGIEPHVLNNFYQNLLQNPQRVLSQFIKLQLQGGAVNKEMMSDQPLELKGLKSGLTMLGHWDLRMVLHQLEIPVGFLFGRLDSIIPCRTMDTIKKNYPHFTCVLFNHSAHVPFLSEPKRFFDELGAFLK